MCRDEEEKNVCAGKIAVFSETKTTGQSCQATRATCQCHCFGRQRRGRERLHAPPRKWQWTQTPPRRTINSWRRENRKKKKDKGKQSNLTETKTSRSREQNKRGRGDKWVAQYALVAPRTTMVETALFTSACWKTVTVVSPI